MLRSRAFWTLRAIAFHVVILLVIAACLALGYWQLRRGEAGNVRSYGYALEWPFFAGAAAYMWWRTMRDETCANGAVDLGQATHASQLPVSVDQRGHLRSAHYRELEPDPELDAYNAYLADLNRTVTAGR